MNAIYKCMYVCVCECKNMFVLIQLSTQIYKYMHIETQTAYHHNSNIISQRKTQRQILQVFIIEKQHNKMQSMNIKQNLQVMHIIIHSECLYVIQILKLYKFVYKFIHSYLVCIKIILTVLMCMCVCVWLFVYMRINNIFACVAAYAAYPVC